MINRNLFKREWKSNATALLIWTLIITLLITLTMSVYRVFLDNNTKVLAMMSILPKGALQFKGISSVDALFSVLGFYSANNVIYMLVLGSIYSIVLSSGIILKEEYNKTAEFLLSWPLDRSEVFMSKLAVVLLNVLLLNLITSIAGLVSMTIVKKEPFSIDAFLILTLYTFLLNLLFAAVGLLMSSMVRKPKPITTLSIGLVLILYFVYTFSKITENVSKIGYLTPFRYVSLDTLNPSYRIEFWNLFYFISLSLLLTFIAFRLYRKKDIYV
jgi:ABC-2 type transport system permease protein